MSFPTFDGAADEDAQEYLDYLEIACLVTGRDDDATRLCVFPRLMKAEAKAWFNTLLPANRGDWAGLKVLFLAKFGGGGETSESLWGKVCELRQGSLFEYNVYELQFVELWDQWVASLRLGKAALDFLKKDRFVAGLCPPLREKPQPQQPPPPPPPIAPIPPLPIPENRAINVISLDAKVKVEEEEKGKSLPKDKGKAKVEDVDAMRIKRARQEEVVMSEIGERRKSKENGESSSKKNSKPRQKLTFNDFALGESSQPYNLVDDVYVQGPKITLPQLLHLAPKVHRQWTKMVSTRHVKTKAMGLVSGRNLQDITAMLDAYVKGQRVSNVYVDGGAQICVMTEQTMHHLGLKVNAPAPCKAKMANNSKVKCLCVINALKIKVCEIDVEVDVYVMPTKGEGYPIILGRPWLMAMHARQDWGTCMLELQPHKGAKKGNAIHIDLRGGKHESLNLETSVDEFSSSDYSTSEEESIITYEGDSSQSKIMGVVLTNPTMVSSINVPQVEEGKLAKMLAKDMTQEERQAYLAMLEGYPRLFIDGYDQITGVSVVQHHINLEERQAYLARSFCGATSHQPKGRSQTSGFIYPVEDSEWVSPVVVTPKKKGKWRVCVDYKPLNATSKHNHFPLPFQDEILNEVAGYESSRVLHLEKQNEGLARLQSLCGQLNVDKCHIAESQVPLLGHVVSSRGIEADPGKVQALVKVKAPGPELVQVQAKLRGAHCLYFDGAYKRKVDKVSVGISIQDENGQKVFGKGLLVENTHFNNEAEYAALALGLQWCVSMGIKRLNVFGDTLLLIKQMQGTWACRNQSLVPRLRRVKELMKRFEAIQLYHVPRKENQEADALASAQL
ncbi:hypothetical protein L7F22_053696 [Adiantum nelumboides]|nr:hypothetical protein [Adiantum nelumboides]